MNYSIPYVIYTLVYFITILYFVVLGCYMLMRREGLLLTRGEQAAKQRLNRTVGITMLMWAFLWFIYLPPMLSGIPFDHVIFRLIFLVTMMFFVPVAYTIMFAVVQRRVNILHWATALSAPFVLLIGWQIGEPDNYTPDYIAAVLSVGCFLFMLVKFSGEYRHYIQRIRSEYSDITCHAIVWAWICFSGFALQGIVYVLYMLVWSPILEIPYLVITVANTACLCHCVCRQRMIDQDTVPDTESEEEELIEHSDDKAFYLDVEQRLKTMCEEKLLFLDPDITRETLCLRLAINRTYLGLYFRSRELTFYQYINTLRVEYAYQLMLDNPQLPIHKVSEQSGFRSPTTFRKVFQDVMGCLPSNVQRVRSAAE